MDPLYILLREVSVQVPFPFSNWTSCIPVVDSYVFFIYFGDQTLVQGIIGKYVFPYGCFPFHFVNVLFSPAETF